MIMRRKFILNFVAIFSCILFLSGCSEATNISESTANNNLTSDSALVTFIELGSVKCIPCKQMQPVMDAIEKEYAGKVKVVFYDVWTAEGKEYGNKYGVRLIPTQVFLDKEGKEIFRHEGFLPKQEIEKVLLEAGVEK